MRTELELQRERVREARLALELAEQTGARSEEAVAKMEAAVAASAGELRRRLISIDRFASRGYLRVFLDIDQSADLLVAIRQLRYLARRDGEALAGYRAARAEQRERREALVRAQDRAAQWLVEESDRVAALESARAELERQLALLAQRRERLVRRVGELGEREERLSRLVAILAAEAPGALEGTAISEFRGALDWPLVGSVVAEFGFRTDPTYGTRIPHNGLTLSARAGQQVRVVYPGRVVFAAPFQSFGDTAVVQHPGGALTLYAGLSRLAVHEGDVLSFGTPLGTVTGELYFEIRIGGEPEDPRSWLR